MKKILFLLAILISTSALAQETTSEILTKPSKGKCMVYIARRETGALLIKFSIYDGNLFLGKLAAKKYFAYECDPGQHAFIAKGENTSYVDANLEENRTYVLDVKLKMGVVSARVALVPLDKSNKKFEKQKEKFLSFIEKRKGELLTKEDNAEIDNASDEEKTDSIDTPNKRMKKFQEMKEKGKKMAVITPDMYFE
ncbi:MAG: DUF2846 domain-containing protein [Bacteroides sp.]|jgi:hypothetical protein|nr:DUF2846 domain-containing protein [Bacteroides sp.]MCI1682279.1 DUF2846 domain-containing protein [Bacteroides sp.]